MRMFFFFYHSFILHRLERRTRPILTPYDGRRHRWDSNLRTPACESPALPLCYGRQHTSAYICVKYEWSWGVLRIQCESCVLFKLYSDPAKIVLQVKVCSLMKISRSIVGLLGHGDKMVHNTIA